MNNSHTIAVEFRAKHSNAPKGEHSEHVEYRMISDKKLREEIECVKQTFIKKQGTFNLFVDGELYYKKIK